jgi:hypothetical protein
MKKNTIPNSRALITSASRGSGHCLPQARHIVATTAQRFEYALNGSVTDLPGTSVLTGTRQLEIGACGCRLRAQFRYGRSAVSPASSARGNVAAARGIQLDEVTATVEGDIDLRGIPGLDPGVRNGFHGIRVTFHVKGAAEAEKLAALVRQSQSRSAVYDVITNGVPVKVEPLPRRS